jgi:hypothetical protein
MYIEFFSIFLIIKNNECAVVQKFVTAATAWYITGPSSYLWYMLTIMAIPTNKNLWNNITTTTTLCCIAVWEFLLHLGKLPVHPLLIWCILIPFLPTKTMKPQRLGKLPVHPLLIIWYHSYQQKLWNNKTKTSCAVWEFVLIGKLHVHPLLVCADYIIPTKHYETKKTQNKNCLTLLCENYLYCCLVNYWFVSSPDQTIILWNNNCLLCGNSLANYLNLMSVWEFVV